MHRNVGNRVSGDKQHLEMQELQTALSVRRSENGLPTGRWKMSLGQPDNPLDVCIRYAEVSELMKLRT